MSTTCTQIDRRAFWTWLARVVVVAMLATIAVSCARDGRQPIVVLVGIDGYRWDYTERFHPPALEKLATAGVRAEGLIPQFPSKTFPNHYAIATGLTLAHNGILSNNMVAPDVAGRFALNARDVLSEPGWWKGEPIWNTAERQGLVAAPMFWPGSEAVIGGHQATYWLPFKDSMPDADRVQQLLEWLKLPDGKRPSFLSLYFSGVDVVGHNQGPESAEIKDAVLSADRSLGAFVAGVEALGLSDRVHYVVVSDHGMAQIPEDHFITLDDYLDPSTVDVVDWSPVLAINAKDGGSAEAIYAALKDKHPALTVYRNADIPAEYGALAGNPRVPAVFAIADEGWYVTSSRELDRWEHGRGAKTHGTHGYDARLKSMQGVFIASGPKLKAGLVVPPFENIDIYDLMCALLGIEPAPNDGDPAVTRGMLK